MKVCPVNILALPRSGTTWLAKMIAISKYYYYVPEIFNPNGGVYNKSKIFNWYEIVNNKSNGKKLKNLDKVFRLTYSDERSINYIKKTYSFFLRYYLSVQQKILGYPQPVINDPFIVFSQNYIKERYNTKNIILLRHPAAIYLSFKRVGWNIDLNNILENAAICEQLLKANINLNEINSDEKLIYKISVLWKIIYEYLKNTVNNNNDYLFMKHEDLSLNPKEEFARIYKFLGLSIDNIELNKIADTTTGYTVNPQNSEIHVLKRNSKSLAFAWKDKITKEELGIIKELTNPLLSEFY